LLSLSPDPLCAYVAYVAYVLFYVQDGRRQNRRVKIQILD